ncbi:MAG: DUF2783 domain-containing protein [Pseudomonadota bacterium]
MTEERGLGNRGDDFYELLMQTHEGLSEAESHVLNARLVLMMANEIGDINVLQNLLEASKRSDKPEI